MSEILEIQEKALNEFFESAAAVRAAAQSGAGEEELAKDEKLVREFAISK